jgi:hypothetical protein
MPRLSLEQQEQSIGRLNGGQQLIAQAFNVHECTIQRLHHTDDLTIPRKKNHHKFLTEFESQMI